MDRLIVDKGFLRVWEFADNQGVMIRTDIKDDKGKWHLISIVEHKA